MMIENPSQDPEIRYTPSGLPLVNFSVATDESYPDKETPGAARVASNRGGREARTRLPRISQEGATNVRGRTTRYAEWESNSDGRKQHRTEIVAAHVQFLSSATAGSITKRRTGFTRVAIRQ